jgi:4-amino-4-deoxy-L-arabinose transferase-like glycosyltransferase
MTAVGRGAGRSAGIGRRAAAWPAHLLPSAALGGCVALFLAIALHQLPLPGLYYDEALDLAPMLPLLRGEPTELLRGIGVTLAGRSYPVMLMDYMGSLNGYLSLPFLATLGPGVAAARLQPILFSALAIVLACALARAWFGRAAGLLTALLLAVNPSFIWFSRQGISVTSTMTVFSLASLLLLDAWRRANPHSPISNLQSPVPNPSSPFPRLPLLLAGACLGLGLWDKLIFLWWIIVVGVMALAWLTGGARARLGRLARALPWAALGFLAGAGPLIYYNLRDLLAGPFDLRNAHTLHLLLRSLLEPTAYGVNNLDVLANLGKALADFQVFVDGSYFWYNGVPFSNVFAMPALAIAAAAGSLLALRRPVGERRRWFAVLASIAATVAASAFTVSGLWATHLFILVPLPQMALAAAAAWLARTAAGRLHPARPAWLAAGLAALLLALPVSRDLWVSQQHHATLAETGGSGRFSDAVYKLAAYLDAQGIAQPVALDWGIEKNVRVLTADRVRPVEIFGFTPEPGAAFEEQARALLRDPSRRYVVLWDRFAVYNRRLAFEQIARQMGLDVAEAFIAHERSGLPVYVVLQAQAKP